MSQENVEIVRAVFAAWNAEDMDAFRELHDPHVVVRTVEGWPEPGPYFGREAVMRWFEQLRETWDSDTVEMIGVSDSGRPCCRAVGFARRGPWPSGSSGDD